MIKGFLLLLLCLFPLSCLETDETLNPFETDGDSESEADTEAEEVFLAAEQLGPYQVGAMNVQFADSKCNRELTGVVWYPTELQIGLPFAYVGGLLSNTGAIADAPLAEVDELPLVVFSHGHNGFDAQSFGLCQHLASHGYLVVSCNHKEDTFMDLSEEFLIKSAMDRPKDVSCMIDSSLAWNETEDHLLKGHIDAERIGLVGHSFGGYTSVASVGGELDPPGFLDKCEQLDEENWGYQYWYCSIFMQADSGYGQACNPCTLADERIRVSVPMAPAFASLFRTESLQQIDIPMLLMAGSIDQVISPPEVRQYYDATPKNVWYWELAGATHYTFCSVCDMPFLVDLEQFGCQRQQIENERAYELIDTATTAFLGMYLKDDSRYTRYFESDYLDTATEITLLGKTE